MRCNRQKIWVGARLRSIFTLIVLTLPVVLSSPSAVAQLPISLTTQEALPGKGITGVNRTNEPVSVGLPLADSANVSSTSQLGCSTTPCQFRTLAKWPDGNIKWVQFDYLDSLAANGTHNTVSLTNGSGNVGTAISVVDDGHTITVNTGTEGATFVVQKANFDVLHSVITNSGSKTIVNGGSNTCGGPAGTSGCLALMAQQFGTTPIATCSFASNCTTLYSSANDSTSTCSLEENGPVHVAVKCWGGLKDALGNKYMGFQVRMHFYANSQRVKIVATLKNADDGAAGSFAISHKGYQSLDLRLATTLSGSNNWAIGTETATPASGNFGAGTQAYIYQGFAQIYLDSGFCGGNNINVPDASVDIPRIHDTASTCAYGQVGYLIMKPDGTTATGTQLVTPAGWADVQDGTGGQGVEFGIEHMATTFPGALEIMNSGREIRIGISPDQALWTVACPAAVNPCQKIYYQAWPQYKLADVDLIFHDSDTNSYSESGATRQSNDFERAQYPLIARAAPSVYNNAQVFTHPIIDGNTEDAYWHGVNATAFPSSTNAIVDASYNVNSPCPATWDTSGAASGSPPCLYFTRYYPRALGSDLNQIDDRYSDFISRWIGRGHTGRYLKVKWYERQEEMRGWPRADQAGDGPNCPSTGPLAGHARWACHSPVTDLDSNSGGPTRCAGASGGSSLCNEPSGMLPNNSTLAYNNYVGLNENFWSHGHWWELIYYYYMTGDEDAHDLLNEGPMEEFTAIPGYANRTTYSNSNVPWPPATGQSNNGLGTERSISSHLNGAIRFWQYLDETGGLAVDISAVRQVISNNLNMALSEDCATDASGNTYPSGCIPRIGTQSTAINSGITNSPEVRGISWYRGFATGPNAFDNAGRTAVTTSDIWSGNCGTPACSRRKAYFFQGLYLDSLWAYTHIFPSSDPDWQRTWDAAYGVAYNTDYEMYRSGLTGTPFATAQLLYDISLEAGNTMTYGTSATPACLVACETRDNQISTPWMNLYLVIASYTGFPGVVCATDATNWRCHVNNNYQNKGNPYAGSDYGSYESAAMINLVNNPPAASLQTVGAHAANTTAGRDSGALSTSYSSGPVGGCSSSCWTLTWTAPAGVQRYYLKEHDSKTIVENIGWDPATANPIGDPVNTRNWWASGPDQPNYVTTQPTSGQSSILVSAPSTASFMLKALSTGSAPTTFNLTVTVTGSGLVTSIPSGINCPGACTANFNSGTSVTLIPSTGPSFTGWSGDCSGTSACTLSMSANHTVGANFVPSASPTLTVALSGPSGSGTVTSSVGSINCPGSCGPLAYTPGSSVTLTANPASGYAFSGWTGDCTGTSSCLLSMSANHTVTATFSAAGGPAVTLSPTTLTLPNQVINTTSAPQTVTLTNSGAATLSLTSTSISGDFAFDNTMTCPRGSGSLNASSSCTIKVKFTPTATGNRVGVVTVTDTASNSPQSILLYGTGVAPQGGPQGGVTLTYPVLVDSLTLFVVQADDLESIFACPQCYFQSSKDVMLGQALDVRLRPGVSSPTADQVILKQGTVDGQIASVQGSSFVLEPSSPIFAGQSLMVLSAGATVFENFPANASPAVGEKVAVRGLLLRSAPGGPTIVAKQISLMP